MNMILWADTTSNTKTQSIVYDFIWFGNVSYIYFITGNILPFCVTVFAMPSHDNGFGAFVTELLQSCLAVCQYFAISNNAFSINNSWWLDAHHVNVQTALNQRYTNSYFIVVCYRLCNMNEMQGDWSLINIYTVE